MVAAKKASIEASGPAKASKSSSWFSKWIPGTIAKKAMEAFKLIEKAVFVDNVEESENNKVQVLEIQVKKLQQKVDELMKLKMGDAPASQVNTKVVVEKSNNQPQVVAAPAMPQVEAASKPVEEIVKSNTEVPVRPRPFSAADLMVSN